MDNKKDFYMYSTEHNSKLIVVIIDGFFLPDSQISKEEKD
jgi:hypothetical protein